MTRRTASAAAVLIVFLAGLCLGAPALRAQPSAKLAAAVEPFVDRQELAGAVMLVADQDKVLAAQAVGWANVAAQRPMRPDSMFWIASQSKCITGAALMMLVDEDKVCVDAHSFGHGGAYSTGSVADTQHGLILVWLVQHAGFPGEGGKAQGAFQKTAVEAFGGSAK